MQPPLDGFLVELPVDASAPARGWPAEEIIGDAAVWFHGYLADPVALRHELALVPSASACRIVAAGWRRWRANLAARIFGEFAALIVTAGEAVAIGDRMGLRPLYYASRPNSTVVSTDLGALVRETGAWRDLDEEYLADLFSGGLHLGPRTPYRDVKRSQVGEFAVWRAGRLRLQTSWRPLGEPVDGTFAEHQELLRATVTRTVTGALPAGSCAVELSGGLDTSTVLAAAAAVAPMHALSFVHPGDPGSDETEWVHAALTQTSAAWHPIDATRHGLFSAGPELGTFLPAPSRRILNWASATAEDTLAAELGVAAILTGEGGDGVGDVREHTQGAGNCLSDSSTGYGYMDWYSRHYDTPDTVAPLPPRD